MNLTPIVFVVFCFELCSSNLEVYTFQQWKSEFIEQSLPTMEWILIFSLYQSDQLGYCLWLYAGWDSMCCYAWHINYESMTQSFSWENHLKMYQDGDD